MKIVQYHSLCSGHEVNVLENVWRRNICKSIKNYIHTTSMLLSRSHHFPYDLWVHILSMNVVIPSSVNIVRVLHVEKKQIFYQVENI